MENKQDTLLELKNSFLGGVFTSPQLFAMFTELTTNDPFLSNSQVNISNKDSHDFLINSRITDAGNPNNNYQAKAAFRRTYFDVVEYSDSVAPQDWDLADIEYGEKLLNPTQPNRSPVLIRFDNNWWVNCSSNGLKTVEQMINEGSIGNQYFKAAHTDTGHRLKPEFL